MKRFIHIPKTGGTSIKEWLRKFTDEKILVDLGSNITGYHNHRMHCRWYKFKGERTEKFSTIRNPFHRTVSGYNYLKFKLNNPARKIVSESFEDFVISSLLDSADEVFLPQIYWLKPRSKRFLKVEHFFKIETEIEELQYYLGYHAPIPKINISTQKKYAEFYKSKEVQDIVREKYYLDFKLLGYDIDTIE